MIAREPSLQLVASCLLEGCRPVPVDAVVCGRCETCLDWERGIDDDGAPLDNGICAAHSDELRRGWGNQAYCWTNQAYGCTDWKPREAVGEKESAR